MTESAEIVARRRHLLDRRFRSLLYRLAWTESSVASTMDVIAARGGRNAAGARSSAARARAEADNFTDLAMTWPDRPMGRLPGA